MAFQWILKIRWNRLGKIDPFRAILSNPHKKKEWQTDEFFSTGDYHVEKIINTAQSLDINFNKRKALDFGCGVGRCTQRLARYFDYVIGVDIAPSMLSLAKKYNRTDQCEYYLNDSDHLALFDGNSFDLILSILTFQHIRDVSIKKYLRECLRILAPGGIFIFQLPSEPILTKYKNNKFLFKFVSLLLNCTVAKFLKLDRLALKILKKDLYWIKKEEVIELLESDGARVVEIQEDNITGPDFKSYHYFVTKPECAF